MNQYTVILYCACGCDQYELHHVFAKTPQAAAKKVKTRIEREVELITTLKGFCEEA